MSKTIINHHLGQIYTTYQKWRFEGWSIIYSHPQFIIQPSYDIIIGLLLFYHVLPTLIHNDFQMGFKKKPSIFRYPHDYGNPQFLWVNSQLQLPTGVLLRHRHRHRGLPEQCMGPGAGAQQRRRAAGGGFHHGHAVGVVGAGVDVPWGVQGFQGSKVAMDNSHEIFRLFLQMFVDFR